MLEPRTVLTLIAITVVAVGGAAWLRAIRRLFDGQPILPYEPRRHVPWGLFDLVLVVVMYVAAMMAVATVGKAIGLRLGSEINQQTARDMLAMQIAIQFLGGLPVLALIALRTRAAWRDLGVDWNKVWRDLRLGVLAFTMLAPPVYAIQAALTQFYPYEHTLIDIIEQDPGLLWLSFVSAAVAVPLTEELQFRLLLQGWLEKAAVWRGDPTVLLIGGRDAATDKGPPPESVAEAADHDVDAGMIPDEHPEQESPSEDACDDAHPYQPPLAAADSPNEAAETPPPLREDFTAESPPWFDRWPIVVSAALFAGMHLGQGPAPAPLFVLALGMGYLYERTHRILPAITVHSLLNATTIVILAVEIYFPASS
ncbi:MAG: type II CAAX endopeptidase family protein [Pirellulaceae bacterium]